MKRLAKYILARLGLLPAAKRISWHAGRGFGHLDRTLIETYVETETVRKLHIGCGKNVLCGWLNSDYYPDSASILHIDATKPFPLRDGSFDYVFSEHMIEHISYSDCMFMLRECYRILRSGGRIRISTPNLSFLVDLYTNDKSEMQRKYIRWATESFCKWASYPDEVFVINNFVRDWGHLFIYDDKTLRAAMEEVGFTKVVSCKLQESESEALRNLENEARMPEGFLGLETFTLEGTKAGGDPRATSTRETVTFRRSPANRPSYSSDNKVSKALPIGSSVFVL